MMIAAAAITILLALFFMYKLYKWDPTPLDIVNDTPRNFGGWLVLIAFGLIVRPFYLIFTIFNGKYFCL